MDNLIVMTPRAPGGLGNSPYGRGPLGGSAEILFFTGVRYFRQVEEAAFLPKAPTLPKVSALPEACAPRRRRPAKVKPAIEAARLEQQA